MKKKKKLYAIRHKPTGLFLSYAYKIEYCMDVECFYMAFSILPQKGGQPFTTFYKAHAEGAIQNNKHGNRASETYESPIIFDVGKMSDLEVIAFEEVLDAGVLARVEAGSIKEEVHRRRKSVCCLNANRGHSLPLKRMARKKVY